MTLYLKKHITRDYVLKNLSTIFLLEDNMQRAGLIGPAQEMRREVNFLGVPTKWSPYSGDAAYFCNDDLPQVHIFIDFPFDVAIAWLRVGRDVCIPADGFGTGLAQLATRAPNILKHLNLRLLDLKRATHLVKEID